MAPHNNGSNKRKMSHRGPMDPGDQQPRQSPHRPADSSLAQRTDLRENGGRRTSRGGQGGGGGGRGGRRESRNINNPNTLSISAARTPSTAGPMSPPAPRPSSATQTPTPTTEVASPLPRRDPEPFDYEILSNERMAAWDTAGRKEVIELGIEARESEDVIALSSLLQELVRATLDVRLEATDAGKCVQQILGPDSAPDENSATTFDPQTLFIDILSMMVPDVEPTPESPFPQELRTFVAVTTVSPLLLRQKLDSNLAQNLGLTRGTFKRVAIRQATHLLYRQANYNLLREETEGYSKLVTDLFTCASQQPTSEVVGEAFEMVKGLIGTFDLDVGRVLDITMDIFAAVLVKQFRFFVKFLRMSSWWPRNGELTSAGVAACGGLPKWALPSSSHWMPLEEDEEGLAQQRTLRDTAFWIRAREAGLDAFFELGGRQPLDAETKARLLGAKSEDDAELDADRQWIEGTNTLPPPGNRTAAQLLGFKLRFYCSDARGAKDELPPNLLYLTALLIKIGFISLRDVYPHLWPLDGAMNGVREERRKKLEEEELANRPGGGASNALMMAGALVDDTLPNNGRGRETAATKTDSASNTAAEVDAAGQLPEILDQKVLLLTNLLTIGAIPEALFILGRFPWLPEAFPDLLDLIHRILHHSIKDVYDQSRSDPPQTVSPTKEVVDVDQGGVPKGQVRVTPLQLRNKLRWPHPDKNDTNEGNASYRFYWDEWADNIPVCQSVDDFFTLCNTFLNYSGVCIGKDPTLLSKMARIGTKSLTEDSSQHNLDRWQDLLKRILVPALSHTKANTSVANELYDMLRFYPISIRYSIYAEWFEGQTSRLPAMKVAFTRTTYETKAIMKRISKTNITAMARSLAKTSYTSPGVVFSVALNHIEAYSNLTEVVVECAKYFSDLGYDVLVWTLLSALGGKNRDRNNSEFVLLPSKWLLALSRFSGKVFKRYSIMNISPILQYVNEELYNNNSTDLVILKELIGQMSGIVPDTDFTDTQLTAMMSGPLLRQRTLVNLQDKRYESTKTASRLMEALTKTKLAGPLLISIAQHWKSAIYRVDDSIAHIKLLSTMIDDSQLIMFQYLDLLRSNLTVEEFDKHVPDIPQLLTDFGLDPTLAFLIGRRSLSLRITIPTPATNETKPITSSPETLPDLNGDVDMDVPAALDDVRDEAPAASPESTNASSIQDVLRPIIASVKDFFPEETWNDMSPEFYVTFWTLANQDLVVVTESYKQEFRRIVQENDALTRDRSDMTRSGLARKAAALDALKEKKEALMAEMSAEIKACRENKPHILKDKDMWFARSTGADAVSDSILEKCLIPRLLLSPTDADYAFKMVRFLHDNGVPTFRTLSLYGRLFKANRLRSIIGSCTVREAENLGRFLRLVLLDLFKWWGDKKLYEREAWGKDKSLPGFAKTKELDSDGKPKSLMEHEATETSSPGKTVDFKSVLGVWHKALNSALRECLDGTKWMHIRNAITILKSVAEVFPTIDFMGNQFIRQLEVVAKREKNVREDLSLTGNAVLVLLKKKSSQWITVQAFGSNLAAPIATKPSATLSKTALKPTAPEFKPQSRSSSESATTTKPTQVEIEDGEVDDIKSGTKRDTKPVQPESVTSIETQGSVVVPPASLPIPIKSDVLMRRDEQKRREKEAAMVSSSGNIPNRPEPRGSVNSLPGGTRNLPSRPDGPFPSRQMLDRQTPSRHNERRDGRDTVRPDTNRLDRPGDGPREFSQGGERRGADSASRDFPRPAERGAERERSRDPHPLPQGDRRGAEPTSRDFPRVAERGSEREQRIRDPPPRWTPESARENQERAANSARPSESSGRLSRDNTMPPPRASSNTAIPDRGPHVNPERLPLVASSERQEIINPARAALIGVQAPQRSDSPHRGRDDPKDHVPSRAHSPRRNTERDHSAPRRDDHRRDDYRRDDRTPRNPPAEPFNPTQHGRPEDIQHPPAGPRSERNTERSTERLPSLDRSREVQLSQSTQAPPRLANADHGRLNTIGRSQPDPNFGRLNSSPAAEMIPSGPRERGPRSGNRMASAPQPRRDGRPLDVGPPRPPSPAISDIPTGPMSGRHPRRQASVQFDVAPSVVTTIPVAPSIPSPGIHPERLRQLANLSPHQPIAPPAPPPPSAIHPDRLPAFDNNPRHNQDNRPDLPASQPSNSRTRPRLPAVVTNSGPPLGPRGSQASPISSGSNGLAAPTGPASNMERGPNGLNGPTINLPQGQQRAIGRRQITGIQTLLSQANGNGSMNVRGRGGRMSSSAHAETPTSAPSTPIIPPPPPGPPPGRPEQFRDLINPARADLITGGSTTPSSNERESRSSRRGRESGGRHSRRSSKSPTGGDRIKRGGNEEERGPRDHRRESGRNEPYAGREHERDSDRRRRSDVRGEEHRRDSRNPRGEEGGSARKRRSEQGTDMDRSGGHESSNKRPRRN